MLWDTVAMVWAYPIMPKPMAATAVGFLVEF